MLSMLSTLNFRRELGTVSYPDTDQNSCGATTMATEMQAQVGTAATADTQQSAGVKRKPGKPKGAQGHKGKTTHSKKPKQHSVRGRTTVHLRARQSGGSAVGVGPDHGCLHQLDSRGLWCLHGGLGYRRLFLTPTT
jgi:hypothetical protein